MNRKWMYASLPVAAIAAAVALLKAPAGVAAPAPAAAAAAAPDEMRYAAAAPQLSMIRTTVLPAVAVPAGETMSARVVYDDDVTARLGISVAGRVVAIKAAAGDRVRAGQVLAEIDAADFGAALADLHKATADEQRKRLVLERAQALVPGEAIAGKEWEAAQADVAQAHAETLRAQQRVHNLNPDGAPAQGQRLRLLSPLAGVVAERNLTPALEVGPGMAAPLFVVTDPRHQWLLIDVPESLLAQVRRDARVDVESDAFPGQHFQAVIRQLGQTVDPNTRRVVVRAALDNPDARLLPEMFVRATLLQAQGHAVKVPNSALVNRGLYTYVFVQLAPGRFQRRQVRLLSHGSDSSYLAAGLQGGEPVVTAGALLLDADMSAQTP